LRLWLPSSAQTTAHATRPSSTGTLQPVQSSHDAATELAFRVVHHAKRQQDERGQQASQPERQRSERLAHGNSPHTQCPLPHPDTSPQAPSTRIGTPPGAQSPGAGRHTPPPACGNRTASSVKQSAPGQRYHRHTAPHRSQQRGRARDLAMPAGRPGRFPANGFACDNSGSRPTPPICRPPCLIRPASFQHPTQFAPVPRILPSVEMQQQNMVSARPRNASPIPTLRAVFLDAVPHPWCIVECVWLRM